MLVVAASVVVLVFVLLALAARTAPENPVTHVPNFSPSPPTAQPSAQPSEGDPQGQPIPPDLADDTPPSPTAKLIAEIIVAVLVITGVAVVGLVLFLLVRAVTRRQAPEGIEESDGEVVVNLVAMEEHLERSTAELDVDGDVNQAIVRCWEGLELIAKDAGAVRDPAQTAREFTVRVLRQAELPEAAMDELADLYEAALFSGNQLPAKARDDAVRSLQLLRESMGSPAAAGASRTTGGPGGDPDEGDDTTTGGQR